MRIILLVMLLVCVGCGNYEKRYKALEVLINACTVGSKITHEVSLGPLGDNYKITCESVVTEDEE